MMMVGTAPATIGCLILQLVLLVGGLQEITNICELRKNIFFFNYDLTFTKCSHCTDKGIVANLFTHYANFTCALEHCFCTSWLKNRSNI